MHRRFALMSFASLALVAIPQAALAVDKAACVAAYDAGQELRSKSQFRAARDQFLVCADPSCPTATRGDCTTWVGEVDASIPTVTFVVTDEAGADVTAVKILVDGVVLAERLDGSALSVDPGPHKLRFERAGAEPIERDVVVREGEKNRKLDVSWGSPAAPTGERESVGIGSISPGTWVLAGIGVAAMTVFGAMGAVALGEKSDAEDTCMPTCSDSQVSSIRAKFIVADISLGVGIASLGGAAILAVVNLTSAEGGSAARGPVQVAAMPLWGGAAFVVQGEF